MHRDPIEDNTYSEKNLIFDRNKNDLFLNELKTNFLPLSSIHNIDDLYHNFTTTLSYSINTFSIEVSSSQLNVKEIVYPSSSDVTRILPPLVSYI